VKRVIRYLKGTMDHKLTFGGEKVELIGHADSDWAGDKKEFKSTSGFIFALCGGPVAWSSRKQKLTALSVAEAEGIALAEAMKECLWLKPFLKSLGLAIKKPVMIHCDNQAAISFAQNPEFHARTKFIGIRFHRLRQERESGSIDVTYTRTEENVADILTKGVSATVLQNMTRLLKMS